VKRVKIHNSTILLTTALIAKAPPHLGTYYLLPHPFIQNINNHKARINNHTSSNITRLQPHPSLTRTRPSLLSSSIPCPSLLHHCPLHRHPLLLEIFWSIHNSYLPLFLLVIWHLALVVNETVSRKVNTKVNITDCTLNSRASGTSLSH